MPVPTDHLAEEIKEQGVRLLARIDSLDASMRDQGADLRWIKRIGAFVATFLVLAVAGSGRIIWDASDIRTSNRQHAVRLDKMDGSLEKTGGRLDGVEKRLDAMDGHLGGLEGRLGGVEKRMDGLEKRMSGLEKRVDERFNDVGRKLDILIQRSGKP